MEPVFDAQQSVYLAQHAEAKEVLEAHPPKEGDGPECSETAAATGGPVVPAGFDLWVDVNMSIKLKTKNHPEGEWVTLWCDDEPSPSPSEGITSGPGGKARGKSAGRCWRGMEFPSSRSITIGVRPATSQFPMTTLWKTHTEIDDNLPCGSIKKGLWKPSTGPFAGYYLRC